MQTINLIAGFLAAYLLGAIPTAYIAGKAYKGLDIREHGSGNVGATNAFRTLGKGAGTFVLLVDILKGVLATTLVPDLFRLNSVWIWVLLALVAVCGHNWTVFLSFKGGKGIATSLGVLIGLTIKVAMIRPVLFWTLLVWGVSFLITGIVSLSSILAATFLPVLMLVFGVPFPILVLGIIFGFFVVIRHRPNIQRLLNGKESRVRMPFHKK